MQCHFSFQYIQRFEVPENKEVLTQCNADVGHAITSYNDICNNCLATDEDDALSSFGLVAEELGFSYNVVTFG